CGTTGERAIGTPLVRPLEYRRMPQASADNQQWRRGRAAISGPERATRADWARGRARQASAGAPKGMSPDSVRSISIVVPVYNSSESLPELVLRLAAALDALAVPREILLVNDGSRDA